MDGLLQHFGGAVAIIVALVGWLGVLWRDRILDRERAQHAQALQDERHKHDAELTRVRQALDIAREAAGRVHADKLSAYRVAGDVIAATLATFSDAAIGNLTPDRAKEALGEFERTRLRAYIYLGMVAPQAVMTAHDELTDYFIEIIHNPQVYDWKKIRKLGIALINVVRKDIGFDRSPIEYRGPY